MLPPMLLDFLYLAAAVLLTPYFLWRRLVKRKHSAPWRSKLGYVAERSAGVTRVWIHAVSVGEAVAAETLVKALYRTRPELEVVISTTTTTGQEVAAKRYGQEKVFYYPLDFSYAVKRALDRVKPALLVLMELEVWPNMTAEAARRGIPVVVVNGRVTERAARRYGRFWFLVGPSFRRVRRWLAWTRRSNRRRARACVPSSGSRRTPLSWLAAARIQLRRPRSWLPTNSFAMASTPRCG
ncbi:MAG: glycosyltransferase N-terminal domain-containing protein [Planctomycetota bacterium]